MDMTYNHEKRCLTYQCKHYVDEEYPLQCYTDTEFSIFPDARCDCNEAFCEWFHKDNPDQHICLLRVFLDENFESNEGWWASIINKKEKEELYKMRNNFNKYDFDACHVVLLRNGYGYRVGLVAGVACNIKYLYRSTEYFNIINNYENDLTYKGDKRLDVMEVYKIKSPRALYGYDFDLNEDVELVWERQETKEMTVAEIEEELGYSVKIVGETVQEV